MFGKLFTLAVHDGSFHADDVFASAALAIFCKNKIKIKRTRDSAEIQRADFVADVGGVYNPEQNRFDHHQEGGAGKRENGIPYAAFGLVWGKYGEEICADSEVAKIVDERLVQPIDSIDSGVTLAEPLFKGVFPYSLSDLVFAFVPMESEKETYDKVFPRVVALAKEILLREIVKAQESVRSRKYIKEVYEKTEDKRLLVLEKQCLWKDSISDFKEVLFVVMPSDQSKGWAVRAVRENAHSFKNRKDLPQSWAGKRDAELEKITGVSDAIFCHNNLFVAVAKSYEGALKLAQIALAS